MKIIGVELYPITLNFGQTFVESFGTLGEGEGDVIVRIYTDEGIKGVGESMTLGPYYSGESQGTVISLIQEFIAPRILIGEDPFNIDKIVTLMDRLVYGNCICKTGVDFSLHDIMGKKLGIPVYRLLGGSYMEKIPLRWAFGIGTPEEMAHKALTGVRAGYTCLKVKVGTDPDLDIIRVKAIREAVGPSIGITLDPNQAYTPKAAIRVLRKVEDYNVLYVEQPVHRDDLDGMAFVRKNVSIPIGACETGTSIWDVMRIIKKEAADFLNFKVSRSGGFYRSRQIVHMADAAGIAVVGSTQLGLGIELACNAHFTVSTMKLGERPPYDIHGYGSGLLKLFNVVDTLDIKDDIVKQTPRIEKGYLYLPKGPGLGVELSETAVQKYLTPGKKPILIGQKS